MKRVAALAGVGVVLLGTAIVLELGGVAPRAELWSGAGAGMVFLLALALAPAGAPRRSAVRARLLAAAGIAALIAVAALWQESRQPAPEVLLLLIPVALLFATAGLALREAALERRRARLREAGSRLDGAEAERRRWARELHDDTLQELAAVQVLLATPAGVADAREIVGRQIQSLRRLIAQMRPLALDALGLAAALEDLARNARDRDGIDVEVAVDGLPRLPATVETAVYRIVQEALTNAVRHAGGGRVRIEATTHGPAVRVLVRDDGPGAPPAGFKAGHGLLGMQERAELLGAELFVGSGPSGGTVVRLELPAQAAQEM
ncbi:sensor histidine kinase [Dactylosporangium vinaceum]|uniref:Sensor histidine kinase n=1 Tax=Dactylosporangium vinaceum TaxID=53362 RepID=A0ABV5LZX0_9ACTN|nr:sensor histidine kinase [Dactylosporangium vinaceum]UAB94390.1 sensor histidine kinase [Dactylosporangium vinaceum]